MRVITLLLMTPIALLLVATTADARSCSTFAKIEAFDTETSMMTIKVTKGNSQKFFPKPEGSGTGNSKIPKKCKTRILKKGSFEVRTTGGRLKLTQIRSNFNDNMLNNPDDSKWVGAELDKLIADKTKVVVVLRPIMGAKDKKKAPHWVSTIYMPITQPELDEIARLDAQGEDID